MKMLRKLLVLSVSSALLIVASNSFAAGSISTGIGDAGISALSAPMVDTDTTTQVAALVSGVEDYRGTFSVPADSVPADAVSKASQIVIEATWHTKFLGFRDEINVKITIKLGDAVRDGLNPALNFAGTAFLSPVGVERLKNLENRVTTVYGIDLNPTGELGPMTGFDPKTPEVSPISEEILIGKSGKEYKAKASLMSIKELYATYPEYDLDAHFGNADLSSLVMTATAVVPSKDFPLPNGATPSQCATFDMFAYPQMSIPCVNVNGVYQAGMNLIASPSTLQFEVDLSTMLPQAGLIPTEQCAVFPAPDTFNKLRINCLDAVVDSTYWVEMDLINSNPVQFEVVDFGQNP